MHVFCIYHAQKMKLQAFFVGSTFLESPAISPLECRVYIIFHNNVFRILVVLRIMQHPSETYSVNSPPPPHSVFVFRPLGIHETIKLYNNSNNNKYTSRPEMPVSEFLITHVSTRCEYLRLKHSCKHIL